MSQVRINFLNWRPDQDEFNTDGLQVASNVLHDTEGYKEIRGPNTALPLRSDPQASNFIDLDPLGGLGSATENQTWLAIQDTVGLVNIGTFGVFSEYVATAPGTATTASLTAFSSFELEDTIVSCAKFHFNSAGPTGTTIASGYITYSLTYGAGSTWTDLPNNAVGIVCGSINKFAMVGNDGTGNPGDFTLRWSAIGDATSWPTPNTDAARAVQAGQEVLNGEYGRITGIAGGEFFGYVFQQNAITKVTYVGGDVVFTFDTFEKQRGCGYFNRYISVDDLIFFESKRGRHVLSNDQVADIGYGRVDESNPPNQSEGVRIYKNPSISAIFFSGGVVYNYKTDQWTSENAIDPKFSVDFGPWIIGQTANVGGSTLLLGSNGGANVEAVLTTGDADLNTGGRSFIKGLRPLVDRGTWEMRVGSRDNLTDPITWSTSRTVTARTGFADFREEGRYQRFEFRCPDSFGTAIGADIDVEPAGEI